MALPSFARTPDFVPGITPPRDATDGGATLWFAFRKNELLVDPSRERVPRAFDPGVTPPLYIGTLSGSPCFAVDLPASAEAPAGGAQFVGLREAFMSLDRRELSVALTAYPLLHFESTHRFCGACGAATRDVDGERAKACTACGHTCYPRVTPAAIVLVHDGPRVLLTRGKRMPKGVPWYALVAGFVETGETLEQCAAREVREETGVEVDLIEYQGSQPWPFPHQIMVGFRARYAGGEVVIDESELEDARWFDRGRMPPLPPVGSIATAMIDAWVRGGDR
ncbi:MAG TPA: NAD(+) diphosphatase [Polyangiaceae bacterium]|nr:NAD(+) diphosphatase [Polyangiaceae bacterium]